MEREKTVIHRNNLLKSMTAVLFATLFVSTVVAQPDTCTPLVETALDALAENCTALSRNSACYGYESVTATFVEADRPEDFFSAPSDVADLNELSSLSTSALDTEADQLGVALMSVQANIPATLPGQSVIFVLMGNTGVINAADVTADENPMGAFYFTTGIGNPTCNESPDTLIIQSPGDTPVELTINDARIRLASTAFLSLVEDDEGETAFELTMAEGEAVINDELVVPEGHWARLPLDNEVLIEDQWYFVTEEEPFCRETPAEHRENFMAILEQVPDSVFEAANDESELDFDTFYEIEPDPRGCHTPEDDTE
jgi:hypothetical protein